MKNIFIFIISLLFAGQVQAANLDTNLMVISDLHHDQLHDAVPNSLNPLIALVNQKQPGVTNWVGTGDLIHTNVGASGPLSANLADLEAAFSAAGITFKSVTGNHDDAGVAGGLAQLYSSNLYPGQTWSWDIGAKWRVLGLEGRTFPGFTISETEKTWLVAQLAQAAIDGRFVIVLCHYQIFSDVPTPTAVLTASGSTGTVTVTSNTAGTFTTGGAINQVLYLRYGTCGNGDASCWGKMLISQCDGGATCTTGTSVTGEVKDDFAGTGPADFWSFLDQQRMVANSAEVRGILEAAGPSVVKLVLNGHTHLTGTATVNGIEYRTIQSSRYFEEPGTPKTGGLLYLYTDGTWKLRGSGEQTSYNWTDFYFDSVTGSDTENGGTSPYDPWQTMTKAASGVPVGGIISLSSDITGGINLTGQSGRPITVKPTSGRKKISGNIAGSYLRLEDIDLSAGATVSASNSTFNRVRGGL